MGIEVLDRVNEGETSNIAVLFTDPYNEPVDPSSVVYRVDDLETKQPLLGETAHPEPARSIEIELGPHVNRIIDNSKDLEVHVITIIATYGGDKKITAELRFGVVNLAFHEVTAPA